MRKVALIFLTILLLSEESDCQWYYERYGVKDLQQLSTEQVSDALKFKKSHVNGDIILMGIGVVQIIGGLALINSNEGSTVDEVFLDIFKTVVGYVFVPLGICLEICGLILLPIHVSQLNKVKDILGNTVVNVGLINCPADKIFNYSSSIPCISIRFNF